MANKIKSDDIYYPKSFWVFLVDSPFNRKLRSHFYYLISENVKFSPSQKILDLGVTDKDYNYFHKLYPFRKNITAAGLARENIYIERDYPEIKYVQIKPKPPYQFKDKSFDFVHSSSVIEHVGSKQRQQEFLRDLNRIGKSGVVTTPNRWYPLEFHTMLVFIHWLPTKIYRRIFKFLGFEASADEKYLNLLSFHEFDLLAKGVNFKRYKIVSKRSFGFISNYLLFWYEK